MSGRSPMVEAALTLVDAMSFEEREIVAERIASYGAIKLPNGNEVTRFVSALFVNDSEWSVDQIQTEATKAGIESTPKQIYNAVGYLARRNAIRRLGYGRYRVLADDQPPVSVPAAREGR